MRRGVSGVRFVAYVSGRSGVGGLCLGRRGNRAVYERLSHRIGPLLVSVIVAAEDVGEEEQLHYEEYEHQFDDYNGPQLPPHGHGAKSLNVEAQNPFQNVMGLGGWEI